MNNRTPTRILPLRGPQRPPRATNRASRVYLGQTGRPKWLRRHDRVLWLYANYPQRYVVGMEAKWDELKRCSTADFGLGHIPAKDEYYTRPQR